MHELVIYLLFAISCAPLAFWWCCCHGCTGGQCGGACRDGTRPTTATITVSGIVDKFCNRCSEMNGTWVATLAPGLQCRWETVETLFTASGLCYAWYFVVSIRCSATGKVEVILSATAHNLGGIQPGEYQWHNIANPAAANCRALGVLAMSPFTDASVYCNYSGATATVELT